MNKIEEVLEKLESWIEQNGYAGYDPYDFIGQDWIVKIFGKKPNNGLRSKIRKALNIISDKYPRFFFRLFMVPKSINPKGLGLVAQGYLIRYDQTNDKKYLDKAEEILDYLSENYSAKFKGKSWGYPFNWYSRIFIPKFTPSSVVTGVVADAYFMHHKLIGSHKSRKILDDIYIFFTTELKRYYDFNGNVCFSYTPIDNFKVLNASLFTAAFLSKYYKLTKNSNAKELSISAAKYVIEEQKIDGSFYYWSKEPDSLIDHFHTGYVLRHLNTIKLNLNISINLNLGFEFFIYNLFDKSGLPIFAVNQPFPKDTHSFSETLISLIELKNLECYKRHKERIDQIISNSLEFVVENMQTDEGYFIWKITSDKEKIDFPFFRWCQAWMYYGLNLINNKI